MSSALGQRPSSLTASSPPPSGASSRSERPPKPSASEVTARPPRQRSPSATVCDLSSGLSVSDTLRRSEEHTSELQSLMRISYAVFCLKKQRTHIDNIETHTTYTH